MMAKIVKGKAFKGVVNYVLDKKKEAQIIDCDGFRLKSKASIIQSFIRQASLNSRVSKSVCHISLNFSVQDKDKLSNQTMAKIAKEYMNKMGITNTQYIVARHFDKEHPHVHIIFNRVDNNGITITDSNDRFRSEKICKELTTSHGLYFSTGKEKVKEHRLKEPDATKYEIYNALKELIPKCCNWGELTNELKRGGINTEFKTKSGSDEIQGLRFKKNDYLFNGSKVDRAFSYSKIDSLLSNNNKQGISTSQTQYDSPSLAIESTASTLGGLFDIQPGIGVDDDKRENLKIKKKKKHKFGRQI
ncbi:MAG TPA: relaxase/mobilization nuclease domain-containing protein [Dysgonamonadaceae bacterium]|jgi:hypothetical protein|nr:relaxase/mobilization nuclease domain-containing protein [Dysgonamonadaceae bacterium]